MKQMKNGVTIGAVALFALTGCVTGVSYVSQNSNAENCAQDPCPETKVVAQQPAPVVAQQPAPVVVQQSASVVVQQSAPVVAPATVGPVDVSQDLGEGLPSNVQPGECYSRCLAPAVYEDVEEEIEVAPASERTEIIPAVYEWVEEQVVAKEASEEIKTIPAVYEWRDEQIVVREAAEELKAVPARYEWQDEQVVVQEASEEIEAIPAVYAWREGKVMVSPEVVNITITDPGFEEIKEQILVKAPSAKWIKKATHCSPEDVKMGLTDCDTLCYVAVPAMYKTVIKKVPDGTGGDRQEIVIPAEYKSVRTKVVVEPARTEVIPVPAEYKTVKKEVMVEPARTETVEIPAEYKNVRKKVLVEPARTETIPVPAQYKTVKVKKLIKESEENIISIPAEFKTITKKVKVADSKIVWRVALCEDEAVDTKIKQVQSALNQQGFYSGIVNGLLTPETNEAIRAYQIQNGLPQGGGLTMETLEALGIY